jgi:hypothetical protein
MTRNDFTVFMAGELFDHKDLIGNALLGAQIRHMSKGRYRCVLPQDIVLSGNPPKDIRNRDLKRLIECDLAIVSFDGTELDSGTVVEYMVAKFLDIPSVILRSDLRSSGDQGSSGDDWNLMCSFYPRTRIVRFDAMACYRKVIDKENGIDDAVRRFYENVSFRIIENLDSVRRIPPMLNGDSKQLEALYRWALKFPGGDLDRLCNAPGYVENLVAAKIDKGIA